MKLRILAVVAVFGMMVLPGSPAVSLVSAQCNDLTEYVEVWTGTEVQNGTVGVFARGVVEAGEGPCNLKVRTYIEGPDNTELASTYGYGSHIASSIAAVYLDDNSPEGEYEAKTEAWSGQVHFGCSFAVLVTSIHSANYSFIGSGGNYCTYARCEAGYTCYSMAVPKAQFPPNGNCTTYARLRIVVLNLVNIEKVCFSFSALPLSSCSDGA